MTSRWQRLKTRIDPIVFLVTLLVSFVTTGTAAIIYVNTSVSSFISRTVDARIAPYEQYLAANSYWMNDDPDRCLNVIEPMLGEIESKLHKELKKEPVYDLAIACARDSRAPGEHSSTVRRIELKLDDGQLPESAWHSGAIAWFYLRTGNIERAKSRFARAISQFSAEGDLIEEATSRMGLTIIHLLEAEPGRAVQEYKRVARLNPEKYDIATREAPVISQLNSRNLGHLKNNSNLRTSLPEFVRGLRKLSGTAPRRGD